MKNYGIQNKVKSALASSSFDAVLINGYDNVHYISGVELPYAQYRPSLPCFILAIKNEESSLFCPYEWVSIAKKSGQVFNVVGYQGGCSYEQISALVSDKIESASIENGKIGIDFDRINGALFSSIKSKLPTAQFVACDEWIMNLRMIKNEAEQEKLEEVAYLTDHGINGALHHVTVDRRTTELTLAEEYRVHTIERGVDVIGYHACANVNSGNETKKLWANPPKFGYSMPHDLNPGEMVRSKVLATMDGYWSDANRISLECSPTETQRKYYDMLVMLRKEALKTICPGVRASVVYNAMVDLAKSSGIPLMVEMNLGHGIGSSPYERPYINPNDETVLESGMVLVIAPMIKDEEDQIWLSKDTVIVTDSSCEIIGWYKDWREPYIPIASI